jgi:hypothetical protein
MANDQSFSYRLVKISLIILNSLVIVGFAFFLLLVGHVFEPPIIIFILIIGLLSIYLLIEKIFLSFQSNCV